MVYCGRPSASCASCRAKKKRCDKASSGCGQCRRIGQRCPGYRDASTLRVRDETAHVVDRIRGPKTHRVASASSSSSSSIQAPLGLGTPSLIGLPASNVLSSLAASRSSQQDEDDPGQDSIRINGKGTQIQEDEANPIDSGIGHARLLMQDDMHLLINDTDVSSELRPPDLPLSSPSQPPLSNGGFSALDIPLPIAPVLPSESVDELGISYFLTNYTVQDSGPCPGFLNYSLDILTDTLGDSELARVAIRAVGLAGLASTTGSNSIMCKARANYVEAITRVNATLLDSHMSYKDSTIFAVMVLALFETITCCGNRSMEAWKNHINGASSLLMQRGTTQFRTKQGLQIFGEAISHVLVLCSRYGCPVPPRLRFLRVEMERLLNRKTPSWILSTIHIKVMDLYNHVDPLGDTPFLPNEWEMLLSHSAELDRQLDDLMTELPVHWCFKTVCDPASDPRIVYHNTYHIYYNTWVAKIWNGMRACRIILNQVICCLLFREGLVWAPSELSSEGGAYSGLMSRVLDTTARMRDGILASVPQMLGFVHHDADTGTWYLNCSSICRPHLVPASGAYFLLWYLFLAGSLTINTPETSAWVVERLRAIRSATGIQKASYMADLIETSPVCLSAKLTASEFLIPNF